MVRDLLGRVHLHDARAVHHRSERLAHHRPGAARNAHDRRAGQPLLAAERRCAGIHRDGVPPLFKLKDGANVRLTDGESLADTTLQSLQFVGDNLNAVLDAPSSREGSAHQQGRRTKAPIRRITN